MWFKDLDDTYEDALDRSRVEKLMALMHDDYGEDLSPPRAKEVDWVMRKHARTNRESLTQEECEDAVRTYASYLKRRQDVDSVFQKYDEDGDDALNRAELSAYVAFELNGGAPPKDEDIDGLLARCDVGGAFSASDDGLIGRMEIIRAKDEWCSMLSSVREGSIDDDGNDGDAKSARFAEDEPTEPRKGCCAVM
jgi:Ca2+-binding EF-hand superfamily protein